MWSSTLLDIGIDIQKNVEAGVTVLETYDNKFEKGALIGGPKCTYQGITIPCFICATSSARINRKLLSEKLARIKNAGVFKQSKEDGLPFLLMDGHHSCTNLPFLSYVSDSNYLWKVCIGVSYATHMWLPHKLLKLNKTYKTCLYKVKKITCNTNQTRNSTLC
jgi:hypothetical protein